MKQAFKTNNIDIIIYFKDEIFVISSPNFTGPVFLNIEEIVSIHNFIIQNSNFKNALNIAYSEEEEYEKLEDRKTIDYHETSDNWIEY